MTEDHSQPPISRVRGSGPLALLRAGREAMREVPGLRPMLLKGFLLLYGIFALTGVVLWGLLYRFAIGPLSHTIGSYDVEGGIFMDLLSLVLTGLLWLGQAVLLAATLILAFVLALSLMSVWFEVLAARVVAHARGGALEEQQFRLADWLRSIGRSMRDGVRMLLLVVLALAVGFIPLVGPILAIGIAGYVLGWEVREPYLIVRESLGDDPKSLRQGLRWWTLRIGLLPVVLAMVPWIGWLLLPAALTYQVAGVAWAGERGGD